MRRPRTGATAAVLDFVAGQPGITDPSQVKRYTERVKTRSDHQQEFRRARGLRDFTEARDELAEWVAARSWTSGDGPKAIFLDAMVWLRERKIQADGRLTLTELADRVRLSVSPCHRRPRTLERSGAIAGYHAQLDASVLGLTFEALVFVTMRYADRQTVAAFEEHVAGIPNVIQAQRLFGDPDYLLRVDARPLPL